MLAIIQNYHCGLHHCISYSFFGLLAILLSAYSARVRERQTHVCWNGRIPDFQYFACLAVTETRPMRENKIMLVREKTITTLVPVVNPGISKHGIEPDWAAFGLCAPFVMSD